MPKKLGTEPIYIAPKIIGFIKENGNPYVFDELNQQELDPLNVNHKILIYERQVKGWFINQAENLIKYKSQDKGFIVLMICLSYIEGVEEYKTVQNSQNRSREFFINSINKIFPNKFQNSEISELYREARCGLFHNGMVRGQIVINNSFNEAIKFSDNRIKISPSKFLNEIKIDFENFINELKTDNQKKANFNNLYTNL